MFTRVAPDQRGCNIVLKKLIFAAVLLVSFALPVFAADCAVGTALTYANTTCTQSDTLGTGTVTYMFPPNWYSSVGTKYVPPGSFNIRLDPNGAYTFLYSSTYFSVNPGEQVKVVLNFYVSGGIGQGATKVNPWSHACSVTGDALIGFSEQIKGPGGVTAAAYCVAGGDTDPQDPESFTASGSMLSTQIIMELDGNSGTATLTSFGAHYHP
jgi:hypothetical protein